MAQFLPDPAELLTAIARLLDDKVLPVVPSDVQHQVRVAGHLAALLAREARLGPDSAAAERAAIERVVGPAGDDAVVAFDEWLRGEVDPAGELAAWEALVAIARADLAICKPGHDRYEGV